MMGTRMLALSYEVYREAAVSEGFLFVGIEVAGSLSPFIPSFLRCFTSRLGSRLFP